MWVREELGCTKPFEQYTLFDVRRPSRTLKPGYSQNQTFQEFVLLGVAIEVSTFQLLVINLSLAKRIHA